MSVRIHVPFQSAIMGRTRMAIEGPTHTQIQTTCQYGLAVGFRRRGWTIDSAAGLSEWFYPMPFTDFSAYAYITSAGSDTGSNKMFQKVSLTVHAEMYNPDTSHYGTLEAQFALHRSHYIGIVTYDTSSGIYPVNTSTAGPYAIWDTSNNQWGSPWETPLGVTYVEDSNSVTVTTNTNTHVAWHQDITAHWVGGPGFSFVVTITVDLSNGVKPTDYVNILKNIYDDVLTDANFYGNSSASHMIGPIRMGQGFSWMTYDDDGTTPRAIPMPGDIDPYVDWSGLVQYNNRWGYTGLYFSPPIFEYHLVYSQDFHIGEDSSGLSYDIVQKLWDLQGGNSTISTTSKTSKQWFCSIIGEPGFSGSASDQYSYELSGSFSNNFSPINQVPPPDSLSPGQRVNAITI